jgi:phosphohistidine phosphatase SixA
VGHNPTIEVIIELITDTANVRMKAGSLATLKLRSEKWSDFNRLKANSIGELVNLRRPDTLP